MTENKTNDNVTKDNKTENTLRIEASVSAHWDIKVKIDGKEVPRQEGEIKYGFDMDVSVTEMEKVFEAAIDAVAKKAKNAAKKVTDK